MPESEQPTPAGLRRHRFMGKSIDLPDHLSEAQLDGRACIHCGDEHSVKRPVEAWSEQSAQLFECVNVEACSARRGEDSHG
jgi:alpha-D-ribose 1-methylphosphonate 5-phosphate C-P lyase